jgi:hypothetical protein
MDREDIIRMARECQFAHYYESGDLVAMPQLERFATLVAAAERMACAKVCDDWPLGRDDVHSIAAAIRARGGK